jgi:hypothetical protein
MANVDSNPSEEFEKVAFACPSITKDKNDFDLALQFSVKIRYGLTCR